MGLINDLPAWIQEIRDRADKATPGPWTPEDANPHKPHKRFAFYIPEIMSAPSMPQYDGLTEEDANFCARARADVPRLVGMIVKMAEALDKIAWEYAAELGCAYLDGSFDGCLACQAYKYCPGCQAAQALAEYHGEEESERSDHNLKKEHDK